MISRIGGFVRLRAFAHYFGLRNDAADAFNAAFRIPNLLQSLFGEGALAASFIPVYASLVARGDRREADRVAGAVAAAVAVIVSIVVVVGVLVAPLVVSVIAPGFRGEKRELTILITRILFPGAGMLTLSAWCLGVLNSHHRFMLAYAAPVVWNAAMIATLLAFGAREPLPRLAVLLAWGSVAGNALQFAVQLPTVRRVAPDLRVAFDLASEHVRTIGRNFVPALLSRGIVQVSAYIDALLASLLPTGAVTGLTNAQLLYTLPVSLFGISVAASELPAMSGAHDSAGAGAVGVRVQAGLRRIAFFVVPSSIAFLALGDVVAGAVFQTGRFTHDDAMYVWGILAGSCDRAGRIDVRPPLLVGVLRAPRHAHAAPLRAGACGADDRARLPVRDSRTASARHRAAMGRRRADGVGGSGWVDGDVPAARVAARTSWTDGTAARPRAALVGDRGRVGGTGMDDQDRAAGTPSGAARRDCPGYVRRELRRGVARARGAGGGVGGQARASALRELTPASARGRPALCRR